MSWLKFFRPRQTSANIAKERLQVIVAHQRSGFQNPDFLPKLQEEITNVIAKYVNIDKEHVKVDLEQQGDRSVLELNITIPDAPQQPAKKATTAKKRA